MTTTLVRDSIIGDDWIRQMMQANPIARKLGADGQPTGDIITGPVRLAFVDTIFSTKEGTDGEDNKYEVTMLFPPGTDFRIFYEDYYACCGREYPQHYDAATGQYHGLHSPFKNQSEKLRYGGFTPDCIAITSGSKYKPSVVDARFNPIVDPNQLYAGVWAICAVRPYAYGKAGKTKDGQPMKKGVGFGLQSIVKIADDTRFGGGAPDAKDLFAGVKVITPVSRPDFYNMPAPGMNAPAPAIPGYTAAGGGVPVPGQPQQGFTMPQTHYNPVSAAAPSYAPPQPYAGAGAPLATTSPSETEEQRMMREMGI